MNIVDNLNEKQMNDPRIPALFQRSVFINLSIFIISQDYYQLQKRSSRANGSIYHIFKPSNYKDVRNVYHDKTSMDMTLNEYKYLTSSCWIEKHQRLIINMTEEKYAGCYRIGLNFLFVPNTNNFKTL